MATPRRVLGSIENRRCATPIDNYGWYSSTDPLEERQMKTEERRKQILEAIYSEQDQSINVGEWLALQKERDRLLKLSHEKENESFKKEFVQDLRTFLKDIPQFTTSEQDQDVFQSLVNLQKQLVDYSRANNIATPTSTRLYSIKPLKTSSPNNCNTDETDFAEQQVGVPMSPPSPPPIAPPIPPPSNVVVGQTEPILLLPKRVSFLKEINTHQKGSLRHVNIPRTPGGTPKRPPKHWVNSTTGPPVTNEDIIHRALLKKFQNVRVHSTPKGACSPGIGESGSLEISTAWSDKDHCVSDPDLTRIGSNTDSASNNVFQQDPSISSPSAVTPDSTPSVPQLHYSTSV